MFPREMRYLWTLLRARRKGLKIKREGVKDIAEDFTPFPRRARVPEDLET